MGRTIEEKNLSICRLYEYIIMSAEYQCAILYTFKKLESFSLKMTQFGHENIRDEQIATH